jgi:diguanylate cyclase (GGDEF)-like protein/PAS domain S-box-containing protein
MVLASHRDPAETRQSGERVNGLYDPLEVIVSIGVAVLASYVALDLAARVAATRGTPSARYWLIGGALSMGTGIWSMHFIGMLAFRLPIPMSYDIPITTLSLLIAVSVSGFALHAVSAGKLGLRRLLVAGLCMGVGITAMHYSGMAAMQMEPPIRYEPPLFVLSVLIAVVASVVALWIAFKLRTETILSAFWRKAGSAVAMGAAIAGMHYTGMMAADFAPDSYCTVSPQHINIGWLAAAIGTFSFMFLASTLLISVFDARHADSSARLAEYLRKSNTALAIRTAELTGVNERLGRESAERAHAEAALRESEERYRSLFELSPDGILICREGRIVLVNHQCVRLLGAGTREELIGKPLLDILHPSRGDPAMQHIRQGIDEMRAVARCEETLVRFDGRTIDIELSATSFRYEGAPAILVVLRDITERKIADRQLTYLAQYDSLTGLPNRALFRDRLSLALTRAERRRRTIAIMYLDLDRFKEINDTLGQAIGDEVLHAVAELLKTVLPEVDTIARLGGDEFTVILEKDMLPDQVTTIVERVRKAFAAPVCIRGRDIFVTASIGISSYSREIHDVDALLRAAEMAMYHAKDTGRNGYAFYSAEMKSGAGERLSMESLLRRALERQEFVLHYQPRLETRSGKIIGVEALLSMNCEELGLVPAGRFIALAEETGLILPIGEWALETACAQNGAWQAQGLPQLVLSVNLSPRQLQQKNLIEMIARVLNASGLDPHLLEFEVTESAPTKNLDEYIEKLKAIRQLGVSLAMDDFGTGYSSLAHLAKLPLRALKIDRSFTIAMQDDPDAMALVSTILTLAHSLGIKVVAEGVESKEQEKILRLLRCDEIQGSFVCRPLPPDELPRFLCRIPNQAVGMGVAA